MSLDRRRFSHLTAASAIAGLAPSVGVGAARAAAPQVKAIAFDALVVFDLRPVAALTGDYASYWQVTGEALSFVAKLLELELTPTTTTPTCCSIRRGSGGSEPGGRAPCLS